jgi:hypothetical protein
VHLRYDGRGVTLFFGLVSKSEQCAWKIVKKFKRQECLILQLYTVMCCTVMPHKCRLYRNFIHIYLFITQPKKDIFFIIILQFYTITCKYK